MNLEGVLSVATPLLAAISGLAGVLWRGQVVRVAQLEAELEASEKQNRRLTALIVSAGEGDGGMEEMRRKLATMMESQ